MLYQSKFENVIVILNLFNKLVDTMRSMYLSERYMYVITLH